MFLALELPAQTPPHIPAAVQAQLQIQQPGVDITSPVTAVAEFDPPIVWPGEKAFYRVTVDATESSIQWPDEISAPTDLNFSAKARGQLTQILGNRFRPLTSYVYEVRPLAGGNFVITNFSVDVSGERVEIPAANLQVVGAPISHAPARQLTLELSATNVFLGQPFRTRIILAASPNNEIEALREVQFDGDGLMTDKTALRQSIETINVGGQLKPAFVCELTLTPIAAGALKISAQGFTAGREFTGPISIRGAVSLPGGPAKYVLLVSDPVAINARPLPMAGELPGFTGAIGKFFRDPLQLSTNRLRVGEPVQLKFAFHGEGELTRFVPPAVPRSRDWQIIADPPPATSFTLIPQTDEVTSTPAIPFCCFDPETAKYIDLTIPPIPITVVGEGLPVQTATVDDEGKSAVPLKLSGFAATPGKTPASLKPLQLQPWFLGIQMLPAIGFFALWQWDRRRRFLEAHPEIVRRRRALHELRREKRQLQKAVFANDSEKFLQHSVAALRAACAPHFPADARALVCADVLQQLDAENGNRHGVQTVRQIFAAADSEFAATPQGHGNLLELNLEMETLLEKLEAKL